MTSPVSLEPTSPRSLDASPTHCAKEKQGAVTSVESPLLRAKSKLLSEGRSLEPGESGSESSEVADGLRRSWGTPAEKEKGEGEGSGVEGGD